MGIRVDETSLKYQLKERKSEERAQMPFHSQLLKGDLPFTIGGGIGQSRICMFMLQKFHIGEVQIGVWPEQEKSKLEKEGVILL